MVFDWNLHYIRRNGRFAKSWLAATNPKVFLYTTGRRELAEIIIADICVDIGKIITDDLTNPSRYLPLFVAAQLVYGTVRIYQQQVNILYEDVKNLIMLQKNIFSQLHSINRFTETIAKSKRKGKNGNKTCSLLNNTASSQMWSSFMEMLDSEDDQELFQSNVVFDISTLQRSQTFCEINWDKENNMREEELFDAMTVEEHRLFQSIAEGRKTLAELLREEKEFRRSQKSVAQENTRKILGDITNKGNGNHNKIESCNDNLDVDCPENSKKLPPFELISDVISIASTEEFNYNANTICINDIESDFHRENIQTTSTPVPPIIKEHDYALNFFKLPSLQFDNVNVVQKKLKKKLLQIDTYTELPYRTFVKNGYLDVGLRCYTPKDDIVSYYKMTKLSSTKLMATPCKRLFPNSLLNNFKRNLKFIKKEDEPNILKEILDLADTSKEDNNHIITGRKMVPRKFNRVPNTISNNINTFNSSSDQIPSHPLFPTLSHNKNRKCVRSNWDKAEVMKKLLNFWKEDIYPVNMKTVCGENICRKAAAMAFLTILKLNSEGYIILKTNSETNEIFHIEKGINADKHSNETQT